MIKGYLTDKGFEAAVNGQQIFGGHGYIREWGMEQFVRDARIAQIYEGTNGIQALDLVGRKLGKDMAAARSRPSSSWSARKPPRPRPTRSSPRSRPRWSAPLGDLQTATLWLMHNGLSNPNNAGAAAYPYMNLMGIVCLGLMWLRMAKASAAALADGNDNADFHQNKLMTARFFADRIMPESNAQRRKIEAGAESHDGAAGGGVLGVELHARRRIGTAVAAAVSRPITTCSKWSIGLGRAMK